MTSSPAVGAASKSPPVTVIALCYNHERFLIECLESIRTQTFQDFELIVADDCSRDSSPELIEAWLAEHRPDSLFIRHKINRGVCATLNEAISHAQGDFISMIATDDIWARDKIERQFAHVQSQAKDVAVVYSDTAQIDESGKLLPKTFLEAQRPGFSLPSGQVFSALADRNFIHPLASLIRRDAIINVGGYDERLAVEDYDMWLRLAEKYEFAFLPGVVAKYRIVATSITRTLFSNPTAAFSYGNFLICEKWLSSKLLSPVQKRVWASKQGDAAYWLYYHGDPRAKVCLWKTFFRTGKPRGLLLALAASFGLSRNAAKSVMGLVGRRRG